MARAALLLPAGPLPGSPTAAASAAWARAPAGGDRSLTDAERIDLVRGLEVLKCAAEGAQAELTCNVDASQRRAAAKAGVPVARQGHGVASQLALARRESEHRGQIHLGLATMLRRELRYPYADLRSGRINRVPARCC